MSAPLVLTLTMDDDSANYFTSLRDAYFPKERNYLKAHLTLFHHLPDLSIIYTKLRSTAANNKPFALNVTGLVSLGKGVAFKIESNKLLALHKTLGVQWQQFLTPQDLRPLFPHVTIQNKVLPEQARQVKEKLVQDFEAFEACATGLSLYAYQGGPWKALQQYNFEE